MLHVGLAQWLGANVAGLVYANDATANVFVDHQPAAPDRCVAVMSEGGTEADSKLPFDAPSCQVLIRSDPASPQWALDTWSAIYSRVHALRHTTLPDGTILAYALAVQSSPVRLGQDKNGRHEYSLNIRAEIRNPTQERP